MAMTHSTVGCLSRKYGFKQICLVLSCWSFRYTAQEYRQCNIVFKFSIPGFFFVLADSLHMFTINIYDYWLRTADLWCWMHPLFQLSHNFYPKIQHCTHWIFLSIINLARQVWQNFRGSNTSLQYFFVTKRQDWWSVENDRKFSDTRLL